MSRKRPEWLSFCLWKSAERILLVDLAHELIILGRDSWIHSLDPRPPESNWQRIEKEVFAAAPAAETRNQLQSEFGPDYQKLATKNFLLVQPQGRGDRWPKLFEQSHRSLYQLHDPTLRKNPLWPFDHGRCRVP